MQNRKRNISKTLSAISFSKKTDAPAILYARFYKLLAMAGFCLALVFACLLARIFLSAAITASFSILSLSLFFCAFYYKYCLEQKGYTRIQGKITFAKESFSPSADLAVKNRTLKRVSYYHVKTPDGKTYRLPANRTCDDLPEESVVNVYAPVNVPSYERGGITYLVMIWAYELAETEENAPEHA